MFVLSCLWLFLPYLSLTRLHPYPISPITYRPTSTSISPTPQRLLPSRPLLSVPWSFPSPIYPLCVSPIHASLCVRLAEGIYQSHSFSSLCTFLSYMSASLSVFPSLFLLLFSMHQELVGLWLEGNCPQYGSVQFPCLSITTKSWFG